MILAGGLQQSPDLVLFGEFLLQLHQRSNTFLVSPRHKQVTRLGQYLLLGLFGLVLASGLQQPDDSVFARKRLLQPREHSKAFLILLPGPQKARLLHSFLQLHPPLTSLFFLEHLLLQRQQLLI